MPVDVQVTMKTFIDRCGAALLLLVLSPKFAVVAVTFRRGHPGPVSFRQERIANG